MRPAPESPNSTAVILVADDDERVLRAVTLMLQAAGHDVASVSDGEAAVAMARERIFDVALIDRHMGESDGIHVLQQLREIQPMCTRVLLSGAIDLDTTLTAINQGAATHVIEKPISKDGLHGVIRDTLRARQRMIEAYQDLQHVHRSAARVRLVTLLAGDDFKLALQPIVRSTDGEVWGYEALLRSFDPVLNGPLPVLRAVEEHGMVDQLAMAVATRSASILDRLPGDLRLFINLHPHELGNPDGLAERMRMLQRHSNRVVFEITERSSLADAHGWEQSVETILRQGFTLAVDDLGSGYSSLSVLAELQPRFIKIDMSIVRDIDRIASKQRLFDLLCRFSETSESMVVAEGLETSAEADTVKRFGAHLMQGYLFRRPELAEKVLEGLPPTCAA